MGGDNYDWYGTPLFALWEKHNKLKKDDPASEAGKDGGWLLKQVIHNDKRSFETKVFEQIRKYKWISE